MVTFSNILDAYYDCRKTKRRKKAALRFELDYESVCYDLANEINNRTYKMQPSDAFIVSDPKVREVFAANFRDRVVHHWFTLRVEPLFEKFLIDKSFSCRVGKGTTYGINCLQEDIKRISENYSKVVYIGKFDIKGFFTSIRKDILYNKITTLIEENYNNKKDKEDLLWIAEKIILNNPTNDCIFKSPFYKWDTIINERSLFTCGENRGLEVGNKPSQLFANFYMNEFDHMISDEFNNAYGRYVDDFYIVSESKEKLVNYIPIIRSYLKNELDLTLHPDKIHIQPYYNGIKFTGTVVKGDMKFVGNRTVHRAFRLINDMNERPWLYNGKNLERTICRLNSYLGFMRYKDSYDIRKRLINKLYYHWKRTLFIRKNYTSVCIRKCKNKKVPIQTSTLIRNNYWLNCIDEHLNGQLHTGLRLANY